MTVQTKLSFALLLPFLAGPLLMLKNMDRIGRVRAWLFGLSAMLWTVFAVAFTIAPTSHVCLLEKVALAQTLLWTMPLSWHLCARGQRAQAE